MYETYNEVHLQSIFPGAPPPVTDIFNTSARFCSTDFLEDLCMDCIKENSQKQRIKINFGTYKIEQKLANFREIDFKNLYVCIKMAFQLFLSVKSP